MRRNNDVIHPQERILQIDWLGLENIESGTGDLAAFRDMAPFWPLTIATVTGRTVWALLFGRGPLERAMTHLPARRSTSSGRSASRDDAHRSDVR